jgi:2-amino-4-hydroxy-6-hydroxymethyldihydropteridine diphosphokinase
MKRQAIMGAVSTPVQICIGLGSNLANPVLQVRKALDALTRLPNTRLCAHSSLYHNPPMGPVPQPDFVNAVAVLETRLTPHQVLRHLQDIETRQGRIKDKVKWGPRTLDLDLLLYGEEHVRDDLLIVPHPGLGQRAFVLLPLYEIVPHLEIPGLGSLAGLLEGMPVHSLHPIRGE